MSLRTLVEKSPDADLLREMVGFAAQRLTELEVETLTGAAHGARDPDRINHRNGYRDRMWETRAGAVELRIPKLRKGSSSNDALTISFRRPCAWFLRIGALSCATFIRSPL
jgi:transposase-like protein